MTEEELAEIVETLRTAQTDITEIEAKAAHQALPKDTRETLSAFANRAGGGTIILGLEQKSGFKAVGTLNAEKVAADLASWCSSEVEPPIRPQISIHLFEGVHLVVAEIPETPRNVKPCFVKSKGMSNGSYVRTHDGDYHLSTYEVQAMLASRGQPRDDEEPVLQASLADLSQEAVSRLLMRLRRDRPTSFGSLSDDDAMRQLRITARTPSGADVPTVAGLLALGAHPQTFFPQLNVTFVHYPTVDGADVATGERFIDNRAFDGPIPSMVRDVLTTIKANMSRRAIVQFASRRDEWEYPEPALREAIVNALVHRDFSQPSLGSQVQIEMYPDRLLVRNPGGLFGPVSVDSLVSNPVSSARNATLLRLLEDVEIPGEAGTICENRGSGIRVMIQSLRAAHMSLPDFHDRIASFDVVFPNHTLLGAEMVDWIQSLEQEGLTESQCLGLAVMRHGDVVTNQTYRSQTGVDSRVATGELQDLARRSLIRQLGTGRWTQYAIAPNLLRTERRTKRGAQDRRDQILRQLGDQELSRADLARAVRLGDRTMRGWLKTLIEEGSIEMVGGPTQSNRVRYRATAPYFPDGQQMQLPMDTI